MNQLIYFLVFLLAAPLLFSFWVEGLSLIASIFDISALQWFGSGLLVYIFIGMIVSGAVIDFIEAAVHELTHAFMAFLFLERVTYIDARSQGRSVTGFEHEQNPFVILAPYYFPLLAVPFLIVEPILSRLGVTADHVGDFLIGLTLGFHYVMHVKQFSFEQDDLKKVGYIVAIGMTYTLMLIFLVITVAVVLGEYNSILSFFTDAFTYSPEYYRTAFAWLKDAWEQLRPQLGV